MGQEIGSGGSDHQAWGPRVSLARSCHYNPYFIGLFTISDAVRRFLQSSQLGKKGQIGRSAQHYSGRWCVLFDRTCLGNFVNLVKRLLLCLAELRAHGLFKPTLTPKGIAALLLLARLKQSLCQQCHATHQWKEQSCAFNAFWRSCREIANSSSFLFFVRFASSCF